MNRTRYIFITGGVASSLGKGVSIASIGALLEARGFRVTIQKLDPYLNYDPGTMSPFQHGEVYVLDDGAETDLDLGYYERFTNSHLNKKNSVSTGQIYYTVIERERRGEYLGRTVQVIPHITDEIKNRVRSLEKEKDHPDFILVEIGGTVGDIESVPFLEAIRQFKLDYGHDDVMFLHLTFVPSISEGGELKTKPTQHSVKELQKAGIQPDMLLCRAAVPLEEELKKKISLFCNVPVKRVISASAVKHSIYEVPLSYHQEKVDDEIIRHFHMDNQSPLFAEMINPTLSHWQHVTSILQQPKNVVTIALVGKYIGLHDTYLSLYEALTHGGLPHETRVEFIAVDSEQLTSENAQETLGAVNGILIPGGFGQRGIEGKLIAVRYARENKVPFFGICLGMQCAVIEFARNMLHLPQANSTEFAPETEYPVICLMDEQVQITDKGATMRLGSYPAVLNKESKIYKAYQKDSIEERHRHRYEYNSAYRKAMEEAGLKVSATSPDNSLVEGVELSSNLHPWFVAVQYHPEFKSKPLQPHPLFSTFVAKSLAYKKKQKQK